jgi:hypothetical protein
MRNTGQPYVLSLSMHADSLGTDGVCIAHCAWRAVHNAVALQDSVPRRCRSTLAGPIDAPHDRQLGTGRKFTTGLCSDEFPS